MITAWLHPALVWTVSAVLYLWIFWGLYVLCMGIYRAKLSGRLSPVTYALSLPFLLAGLLVDVVANLTLASLVFLELPREWLVTRRLQRHSAANEGWRYDFSVWVCSRLLDVFDPDGDHC